MFKILNVEPDGYSAKARVILESVGEVHQNMLSRTELLNQIKKYDALIVRLGHRVDREIICAGVRLKAIATAATGLDHIDLGTAEEKGITVLSLKDEYDFLKGIYATPEHTWALLLALLRNIPWAFESVKGGEWSRDDFRGRELSEKTLGIIGFGRVGEKVAGYGLAFGMNIIAYDPYRDEVPSWVNRCDTLDELLSVADIVSVHVPLSQRTMGIIGSKHLRLMRPGSLLINTSRGSVIEEEALLRALESKHLAGAALDVLCDELHLLEKCNHLIT